MNANANKVKNEKKRFYREIAEEVARMLVEALEPACLRITVAGSFRRGKELVGDVEILYVPMRVPEMDLFGGPGGYTNRADGVLARLLKAGVLEKRRNVKGSTVWGEKNKLAVHVGTGLPVDLFSTTREAWFNYLVCRTGGAENNMEIARRAQEIGWMWNPYEAGFSRQVPNGRGMETEWHIVTSEREVFEFVGMPYLPPEARK